MIKISFIYFFLINYLLKIRIFKGFFNFLEFTRYRYYFYMLFSIISGIKYIKMGEESNLKYKFLYKNFTKGNIIIIFN